MDAKETTLASNDRHLVLSRRVGESISIGENVRVELVKIRGGVAKLVVHAPKDVNVRRSEIAPAEG